MNVKLPVKFYIKYKKKLKNTIDLEGKMYQIKYQTNQRITGSYFMVNTQEMVLTIGNTQDKSEIERIIDSFKRQYKRW